MSLVIPVRSMLVVCSVRGMSRLQRGCCRHVMTAMITVFGVHRVRRMSIGHPHLVVVRVALETAHRRNRSRGQPP